MAAILLLLSLLSHSFSLAKSINIDCGTNGTYKDDNNVIWVGDENFVTTGETIEIPNEEQPINTLRYFPEEPNNTLHCYNNIPVEKGEKTLVRTRFYITNYDEKLLPAYFAVFYDMVYLDVVSITKTSINDFSEVIFTPASENISVCLGRLSTAHDPFISSIEVYSFDAGMYSELGPDEGLLYQARISFGGDKTVSYPIDPYGRLWIPARFDDNPNITVLETLPSKIDTSGASNKPPETIMSKALSGNDLTLYNLAMSSTGLPVYLALYFSELESLDLSKKRSFTVSLDGEQVHSDPIVPAFEKSTQVVKKDINASLMSQLTFQSTEDSNSPPIINALELYVLVKALNGIESLDQYEGYQGAAHKLDFYEDILKATADKRALGDQKTYDDLFDLLQNVEDVAGESKRRRGNKKKLALGLGVGISFWCAAIISCVVCCCKKSRNSKPESNTEPTSGGDKPEAVELNA